MLTKITTVLQRWMVDAGYIATLSFVMPILVSCSENASPSAAEQEPCDETVYEAVGDSQPTYTLTTQLPCGPKHTVSFIWSDETKRREAVGQIVNFAVNEQQSSRPAIEDYGKISCAFTYGRDAHEVERQIQQIDPSISSEARWSYSSNFHVYLTRIENADHAFAVVGTQGGEDVEPFFYKQFDDLDHAADLLSQAIQFGMALDDGFYESLRGDSETDDDASRAVSEDKH